VAGEVAVTDKPEHGPELVEPTTRPIGELLSAPLITCPIELSVREAAQLMAAHDASAVVAVDEQGRAVGVLTDTDLRVRVVAQGLSTSVRVEAVMSSPPITIDRGAYFFEAVQALLRHRLHRLVVTDGERLCGLITDRDLLAARTPGPLRMALLVERAGTLDDLTLAAEARLQAVQVLEHARLDGHAITRLVAELNDLLVQRALALVEAELGPPPLPYCWLGLGSEGRREQSLRTDQDNALVYEDPPPELAESAERYFASLADLTVSALARAGLPRCKGGVNASNAHWCKPLGVWQGYFRHWIHQPGDESLLHAAIFFDFRAVAGESNLADALWSTVADAAPRSPQFLKYLLRQALEHRPPGARLMSLPIDRRPDTRSGFDIKWAGLMTIVEPVRAFALARGVTVTNTAERLTALRSLGELNERDADDLITAHSLLLSVRLRRHLRQIAAGREPDDEVTFQELPRVEAALLHEHFKVVAQLQSVLEGQLQVSLGG
jgi:CBS domain-containing protein